MDLFSTPYIDEVKLRNKKLLIERKFYDSWAGKFETSRIIYTTEFTCEHEEFDRINQNEFKCRVCSGIITNKQLIINSIERRRK